MTWDGGFSPTSVREEGSREITTPVRTTTNCYETEIRDLDVEVGRPVTSEVTELRDLGEKVGRPTVSAESEARDLGEEVGRPIINEEVEIRDLGEEVGRPIINEEVEIRDLREEVGRPANREEVELRDLEEEVGRPANSEIQPKQRVRRASKKIPKKVQTIITVKQFIDDTTALLAAKDNESLKKLIQQVFNRLESHLIDLGMAINQTKTQLTIINPNKDGRLITLEAGGKTISHQSSLKVLGFEFAEDGKMDNYLWRGQNNLIKTIRNKTSMLRTIKPFTSPKQLAYIANATLNSNILYVSPLWAQTGITNIQRIQTAQTKAARQLVWNKRTRRTELDHRQILFESLGWLNVSQMTNQATTQIVYKALNKRSSMEINRMFTWKKTGSSRNKSSHQITTINTAKRKGPNLLDMGRELYNNLPLNLRNNKLKPSSFKRELKKYSLDNDQLLQR